MLEKLRVQMKRSEDASILLAKQMMSGIGKGKVNSRLTFL